MPAGHVQVAPDSTGKDVDADSITSTESGTPTVYRQNMIMADPTAYGGKARVGTGGDQSTSLTSPAAAALSIFAMLNPYGGQRVSVEPTVLFLDPFDGGTLDTTSRWAAGGNTVPTQSGGQAVLAPAVGSSVNNSSTLISQPTFVAPGLGFLAFASTVTLEASQVSTVNVNRFWGKGQVTSFTYGTPVTDGIGFEVEGTLGALQCVLWASGTKYVLNSTNSALVSSSVAGAGGSGTALPAGATGTDYGSLLTWKGGQHRYAVFSRNDVIYWFVEGTEVPVAAASYLTPAVQTLPVRFAAVTNGSATSLAFTFTASGAAMCDSTAGSYQISDGTFPWRKAAVSAAGVLSAAAPPAATGTATSVAGNASSVTLLAANTARKAAAFYNDSTAILYLLLGTGPASTTAYTVQMPPQGYYELPSPGYTGQVTGIWSAANGNARITEMT